jgi:hypothetical protein
VVRAAAGEFEAVLRAQVVEARRELESARALRDYAGVKSFGLRLRYLLDIAAEHGVDVPENEAAESDAAGETGGV